MLKEIIKPVIACGFVALLLALPACAAEVSPEAADESSNTPITEETGQATQQVNGAHQCCKWRCNNPGDHYDAGVTQDCHAFAVTWCHSRGYIWGDKGDAWWGTCTP